jgi:hypothetical protein
VAPQLYGNCYDYRFFTFIGKELAATIGNENQLLRFQFHLWGQEQIQKWIVGFNIEALLNFFSQ